MEANPDQILIAGNPERRPQNRVPSIASCYRPNAPSRGRSIRTRRRRGVMYLSRDRDTLSTPAMVFLKSGKRLDQRTTSRVSP